MLIFRKRKTIPKKLQEGFTSFSEQQEIRARDAAGPITQVKISSMRSGFLIITHIIV